MIHRMTAATPASPSSSQPVVPGRNDPARDPGVHGQRRGGRPATVRSARASGSSAGVGCAAGSVVVTADPVLRLGCGAPPARRCDRGRVHRSPTPGGSSGADERAESRVPGVHFAHPARTMPTGGHARRLDTHGHVTYPGRCPLPVAGPAAHWMRGLERHALGAPEPRHRRRRPRRHAAAVAWAGSVCSASADLRASVRDVGGALTVTSPDQLRAEVDERVSAVRQSATVLNTALPPFPPVPTPTCGGSAATADGRPRGAELDRPTRRRGRAIEGGPDRRRGRRRCAAPQDCADRNVDRSRDVPRVASNDRDRRHGRAQSDLRAAPACAEVAASPCLDAMTEVAGSGPVARPAGAFACCGNAGSTGRRSGGWRSR